MTSPATRVSSPPGATFLGSVIRSLMEFAKALQHRREIMHLAELDDRMLKDIGLARSDVEGALSEPLFNNPSLVLVRCVQRHMRAERLAAPSRQVRPVAPVVSRAAA